jgi:hypothetical protein
MNVYLSKGVNHHFVTTLTPLYVSLFQDIFFTKKDRPFLKSTIPVAAE